MSITSVRIAPASALLHVALLLSACGLGGPAHGPPTPGAAATVTMGFESYSPSSVTVRVGDTIEWRNTSFITHTVTDDPRLAKKPADAALLLGAETFDSGDIPAGQVYSRKFDVPGVYRYFCTHHEDYGMTGAILVRPGS